MSFFLGGGGGFFHYICIYIFFKKWSIQYRKCAKNNKKKKKKKNPKQLETSSIGLTCKKKEGPFTIFKSWLINQCNDWLILIKPVKMVVVYIGTVMFPSMYFNMYIYVVVCLKTFLILLLASTYISIIR